MGHQAACFIVTLCYFMPSVTLEEKKDEEDKEEVEVEKEEEKEEMRGIH